MIRIALFTLTMVVLAGLAFWLGWESEEAHDPQTLQRAEERARLEAILPRARAGDARAEALVGDFYRLGKGVDRDPVLAVKWYTRAAGKGHVGAQYMLGRMYDTGDGVPQDYFRAAEWYQLAANLAADMEARFRLGNLYFSGRGVPHDYGKAIEFYSKAAGQGHAGAQYVLGAMHEDGWGVDKDLIQAYKWYALATRQGDEAQTYDPEYDAPTALAKLEAKMNEFQLKRGREAVRDWRPKKEVAPIPVGPR